MNKRVTIADVAREAGVSMMTVSRAVNNKEGISAETRERILEIAERIGYHPSGVARALATNRSCTVGLVMPDVANPFFAQIARGAEDAAHTAGYNVFLVNTDEDNQRERSALDSLWEKQVDGAILCSSRLPQEQLMKYAEHIQHTVLINREWDIAPNINAATINVDDELGARMAIEHFIKMGRSQIALIAGPEGSTSSQRRLSGYLQGLKTHAVPYDEDLVVRCYPDTQGGHQAAQELLAQRDDISAILAFNDLVAVGVIQACEEIRLRVPEEVAVIGVDDIPLATLVRPRLSTLRIEKRALGYQAMETLMALINGKSNYLDWQQVIQPTLILRDSAP